MDNYERWSALGVQVVKPLADSKLPYCEATFPDGWKCVPTKADQRAAIYYDPQGVPRVKAFIKAVDSDANSSAEFWSQETSVEFMKAEQKIKDEAKAADENKLALFVKHSVVEEWSSTHPWMVYLFKSGRRTYEEAHAGVGTERRPPCSSAHRHKLVGFAADDKIADLFIDDLIAWQTQYAECNKSVGYMYCCRHLPLGLIQLDFHEYKHIAGQETSHKHPSDHVCLGPKDCDDCPGGVVFLRH